MSIQAITFDFWGTLFAEIRSRSDIRMKRRAAALVSVTGVSPESAERALNDAAREFARFHIQEKKTLTPRDAVDLSASALGVTVSEAEARRLADFFAVTILDDPPVPIPDALEAVRAAASRVPVGIVSDTGISPGSSLSVLLERDGFMPYIACLTFSDETGFAKPRPEMFQRTATALGVKLDQVLHLGDLEPTDIAGIRAVGGKAGLFVGVNKAFLNNTSAEYVFTDWRSFINQLDALLQA